MFIANFSREWVSEIFVAAGMVADICYHAKRQPACAYLLTLRDIEADGFGKKNRSWNNLGLVESWRASWAEIVNRYLEKAGLEIRIDHRSFKRQGLDLTPTKHVGRGTPFNSQRRGQMSMDNKIILMERKLQEQKREPRKAEELAKPQETIAPHFSSLHPDTRPSRVRRQRPDHVQSKPGFTRGSNRLFNPQRSKHATTQI